MQDGPGRPAAGRVPIDELLAQAGWMRSLARGVVGDGASAEDVVQDAYLAALRRSERSGSPRGWRAWMRGAVHRLARHRARREREREAVERQAARPEACGGDLDALERLQLQRELTGHLLSLREPYRSAVILRHLEGLDAKGIAARMGCSPEAARQRVSRGLAELRARLEAAHASGERDWLGALYLISGGGPIAGAALPMMGVTVMSKSAWLGGLAAAGLLAGFGAWVYQNDAASPARGAEHAADLDQAPPASERFPSAASEQAPAAPEVERIAVGGPSSNSTRGLIAVDRLGRPIAGASVRPRGSLTHWDTTDAQGRFRLPEEIVLESKHAPEATISHEDFLGTDFVFERGRMLELVLSRKPSVEIRLHAPAGGSAGPTQTPWKGSVWVRDSASGEVAKVSAELEPAAAGGPRLMVRRLPVGRLERVEGRSRGYASGQAALALELGPDSENTVDVHVREGTRVAGRVVDKATREPIPGAVVWAEDLNLDENSTTCWTSADAFGRFELLGLECQFFEAPPLEEGQPAAEKVAWTQLFAKAEGYQGKLFEFTALVADAQGRCSTELELQRSDCRVRGLVRGAHVLARPLFLMAVQSDGQIRQCTVDGAGRFELEQLVPGQVSLFASNSYTYGARNPELSDPRACARGSVTLSAGESADVELELELGSASLSGRVVDSAGRPVPGIPVQAHMNETQANLAWGVFHWLASSAEDGSFAFEGLPRGHYDVEFGELSETWCDLENHWRCDLETGASRSDARLVLVECSTVEGWVELGNLDPAQLRVVARGPGDAGLASESTVAADARFRLTRLPGIDLDIVLLDQGTEVARVPVGPRGAAGVILRPVR